MNNTIRTLLFSLVSLGLVAGVGACTGGDDESSTTEPVRAVVEEPGVETRGMCFVDTERRCVTYCSSGASSCCGYAPCGGRLLD